MWAWTGWPVHGILAGAAVLGLPFVLNPGTAASQRIERLEALGQWLNHLAGVHQAGISLPQTIRASAKAAPGPIAPNVRALADRLRSGMEAEDAFAHFADELADGVADHVVLLFQSHAVYKGPGLSDALEALAVTIHQQAADARDIEADRAKVRKSSRMVSVVICLVVVGCMLNDAWSGWYKTPLGQLVLALLGGAFAWTLTWLRRIARTKPDPRLIDPLPAHLTATGAAR
ncbi:type II secretion system F family protein [Streptomyces albidoflavus]|uniref:type II secretion system F family protein n=1 Tax=Streptomyces albidoflavus TaxID=1886 RepID=UPI000A99EB4C|nr:type II secretion system F family protein [Streptomyces albidoflavus]